MFEHACAWLYFVLAANTPLTAFNLLSFRWSAEFGSHRQGSPEIHDMLAEYLYSESPELVGLSAKIRLENLNSVTFLWFLSSIFSSHVCSDLSGIFPWSQSIQWGK